MFNLQTMPNIGVAAFSMQLAQFQHMPRKEIRFVSVSQDAGYRASFCQTG